MSDKYTYKQIMFDLAMNKDNIGTWIIFLSSKNDSYLTTVNEILDMYPELYVRVEQVPNNENLRRLVITPRFKWFASGSHITYAMLDDGNFMKMEY